MEDAAAAPARPIRERPGWRILASATRIAVATSVLLAIFIRHFGDRYLFLPVRYPEGDWEATAEREAFEDVELTTSDGVKLHGWFVAQESGARAAGARPKFTILYLHGNAGNLSHRREWIRKLATLPADVFAIDYRGYGRSEGEPSEEGVYLDAEAAYHYLTGERGVEPSGLVVYGKSLGGGPECELALRRPCAGLILQSTFTSIPDMAREVVPLFPAGWFMATEFDNLSKVDRIAAPKLIVHSRADEIVPYAMAERLFEAAAEPKKLVTFERPGHNDLAAEQGDRLMEAFRKFVKSVGHRSD